MPSVRNMEGFHNAPRAIMNELTPVCSRIVCMSCLVNKSPFAMTGIDTESIIGVIASQWALSIGRSVINLALNRGVHLC